jgi:5-methylcytosine-specific restriction protein B
MELKNLLMYKMNLILQGPPGVGKTFCAKRLAYLALGLKDDSKIGYVQFHQNYSYEDFVQGYRPNGSDFELKDGIFKNFCERAKIDRSSNYFFIIDEINRGNISKIFGELLMLIEKDKRGQQIQLSYSGEPFSVPKNVYIIGTMNTADRGLALIDYALRRRFAFYDMKPGFETAGFQQKAIHKAQNNFFDALIKLNKTIANDPSLGEGFCIGHSYFCGVQPDQSGDYKTALETIVNYEIAPLLREYWFDNLEKVNGKKDQNNNLAEKGEIEKLLDSII